jgi:hypothetical protein
LTTTSIVVVYRLPFSIGLGEDCAGLSLLTTIGGLKGRVALPRLEWEDDEPVVRPPSLRSLSPRMIEHEEAHEWATSGLPDRWDAKTRNVAWWATTIALQFPNIPSEHISYDPHRSGRGSPRGEVVDTLFNWIIGWAELVGEWLETLTEQDAGRAGPVRAAWIVGEGVSIWTQEGSVESSIPSSSERVHVRLLRTEFLDRETWRRVVRLAGRDTPVPDEHRLLCAARAWLRRAEYRRAVIDAGTAAELALTRLPDQAMAAVHPPVQKVLLQENRPLGRLVNLVGPSVDVPSEDLKGLVKSRNDCVHRNMPPTPDEATQATSTATALVELVEPLRRFN